MCPAAQLPHALSRLTLGSWDPKHTVSSPLLVDFSILTSLPCSGFQTRAKRDAHCVLTRVLSSTQRGIPYTEGKNCSFPPKSWAVMLSQLEISEDFSFVSLYTFPSPLLRPSSNTVCLFWLCCRRCCGTLPRCPLPGPCTHAPASLRVDCK